MLLPKELVQRFAYTNGISYEESEMKLNNAVIGFETIKAAFDNLMNHIARIFEKIKDIFNKSINIKHQNDYGYSTINPLKNQVLNRKPLMIRARSSC